jgi:hypothetical protein
MPDTKSVPEPESEKKGRQLGRPGRWFLSLAAIIAAPGIVLIVFTDGWPHAVGVALEFLAGPPAVVAGALFLSSLVTHWAARHRSFA